MSRCDEQLIANELMCTEPSNAALCASHAGQPASAPAEGSTTHPAIADGGSQGDVCQPAEGPPPPPNDPRAPVPIVTDPHRRWFSRSAASVCY